MTLSLRGLDGAKHSFADYRGKVVLVDFFATWCLPCVKQTPIFVEWQHQLESRGFTVVGVGLDDQGPVVVQPYVDYFRIGYPVLLPNEELLLGRSAFGEITALPYAVLLDREGRVVDSFAGLGETSDLYRAILDQLDD